MAGQEPPAPPPTPAPTPVPATAAPRPILARPVMVGGLYAWAWIGILSLLATIIWVIGLLTPVVIPLVLALFPAALLVPLVKRLRTMGVPRAAAATIVLLGTLALLAGIVSLLAPSVADELGDLGDQLNEGYERLQSFLASGPFGLQPVRLGDLIDRVQESLASSEVGPRVGEYIVAVVEGFTGVVIGLLALFFYLKDGDRIAAWIKSLFPRRARDDAHAIGDLVWMSIGAYFRGQFIIAIVDAVLIGIGLLIIGVPLVLPLSVLVFFGGLFPIVGAIVAGFVAVLIALASGGPITALIVLALIVGVQQVEGHLLAPVVLGRATELHPLAVILALAAGGILLGIVGAFIAVPVAASAARAVGYLRNRVPG